MLVSQVKGESVIKELRDESENLNNLFQKKIYMLCTLVSQIVEKRWNKFSHMDAKTTVVKHGY